MSIVAGADVATKGDRARQPFLCDPVGTRRAASEVVLTISLAATIACGLAAGLVFAAGHTVATEQAAYVASIGAIVAGIAIARPLARRAGTWLDALAAANAAGLTLILWCNWAIEHLGAASSPGRALIVLAGTALLVATDVLLLCRPDLLSGPAWAAGRVSATASVLALAGAALPFVPSGSRSPSRLVLATIFGVALALAMISWRWRATTWLRAAADVGVCALLLVLVNDLQYGPDSAPANDTLHHLNFYMGPVNDVMHGRTVLVNTFSQYGVGVIYALAAAYRISGADLSYGSFELGLGVLTALWFCSIYILLRLTTNSQGIAMGTVAVAVVINVFGYGGMTSVPSAGVLRFGPPFVVVLLLVVEQRRGRTPWAALGVAALVSLWSIETFAYTVGAVLPFLACTAWLRHGTARQRLGAGAFVATGLFVVTLGIHFVFAIGTWLVAGRWPDWATYFDYLLLYAGGFSKVLIAPLSPGLGVALVLLASAVTVLTLGLRGAGLQDLTRARLPVLAALTGFGVIAYTYFVSHPVEGAEATIGVPVIVLGGIFLDLSMSVRWSLGRGPRTAFVAVVCVAATLLTGPALPRFFEGWKRTPLAALVGQSLTVRPSDVRALEGREFSSTLGGRIDQILASPVASPYAVEAAAEGLVRRYGTRQRGAIVLLDPEVTTEVLVRTDRKNAVPIASPSEDALLPSAFGRIAAAAARLPSGTVLVTDRAAIAGHPNRPALALNSIVREAQARYLRLRQQLLAYLRTRFVLYRITAARSDPVALRLVTRAPASAGAD